MKVKEIMSANPACCTPNDSAQNAAKMMCDLNVGAVPVVADHQSRALVGMITDRDLCCSINRAWPGSEKQQRSRSSSPIPQSLAATGERGEVRALDARAPGQTYSGGGC
jgi:predicted transcriptional regulator